MAVSLLLGGDQDQAALQSCFHSITGLTEHDSDLRGGARMNCRTPYQQLGKPSAERRGLRQGNIAGYLQ